MSYTRKQIETIENKITLVDEDTENNLQLFCYVNCNNNESDLVKQSRGVVFNGENLVMKTFPYTNDYELKDHETYEKFISDISSWKFTYAKEGFLIRLFNFNDRWYTCTHRKLDAFRSKWSSITSFGMLFVDALKKEYSINEKFRCYVDIGGKHNVSVYENFKGNLNPTKQYVFLVSNNNENRIVCDVPNENESSITHIGTFMNGEEVKNDEIGLNHPIEFEISSFSQLHEVVKTIDPKKYQGVYCKGETCFKILNDEYKELFDIRGNVPSIKFRYLQLRKDKVAVEKFKKLYPDQLYKFALYENFITDIALRLFEVYIDRYFNKVLVVVPPTEHRILKQCNTHCVSLDKNNGKALFGVPLMREFIDMQSPTAINHLIKHYLQGKKEDIAD